MKKRYAKALDFATALKARHTHLYLASTCRLQMRCFAFCATLSEQPAAKAASWAFGPPTSKKGRAVAAPLVFGSGVRFSGALRGVPTICCKGDRIRPCDASSESHLSFARLLQLNYRH